MNDRLKKIFDELGLSDSPSINKKIKNVQSIEDVRAIADELQKKCSTGLRERHPTLTELEINIIEDVAKDVLVRMAHHKIAIAAYLQTLKQAELEGITDPALPDHKTFEICVCNAPRLALEFVTLWYDEFTCKHDEKKKV